MAEHLLPKDDEENHIQDPACACDPEVKIDTSTGEMVWIHKIIDWGKQLAGLFKI
jgi:hypothetical protein